MSCSDQHAAAGGCAHGHGHGGHGHGHGGGDGHEGHDHDDPERGFTESLLPYIDIGSVTCGNEEEPESIKKCFRPWSDREDETLYVDSDADEQLLVFVPFTGDVKLKSITLITGEGEARPTKMKVFKNREGIDFDLAEELTAVQEWELAEAPPENTTGIEYHTRITQFQGLQNITLFFPENAGAEQSRIRYIAFKGECNKVVRRTVITVAETAANPADHKTKAAGTKQAHQFGY